MIAVAMISLRTIVSRFALACLALVLSIALTDEARAQAVTTVVASQNGTLGQAQSCPNNPLVRTFSVSGNFTVADVDLGVLVRHTWRGDLRLVLVSPTQTRVQLTDGDVSSINGNNFNVLLDDTASQLVNTDGNGRDHSTSQAPPFQNTYRPDNALSAFNGENANGTWRLEMCDLFPAEDNGQFRHAELYLTAAPTLQADLSLTKGVSNASPAFGSTISFTLAVNNQGPDTATNVEVRDQLPAGFDFISSSGAGSYNPGTGIWSVPDIAAGQTRTMTITGTVTASVGTTVNNTAEIIASSAPDPDSTPDNGDPAEDDYAETSFQTAGGGPTSAPPLTCPAGTTEFRWADVTWARGSLNNSYQLGTLGTISFDIVSEGQWVPEARYGGAIPGISTTMTAGLSNPGASLIYHVNRANREQESVTTITLPQAITGVQFRILDIDQGGFQDRATVYGFLNGVRVEASLTQSSANFVSGDSVFGNGSSSDSQGNGNTTVTFTQPIDTIIFEYGNGPSAPDNPSQQGVGLNTLTFCNPATTTLSVTKMSAVISDPVSAQTGASPKAIPGALVEYLISVENTGAIATDADSIAVLDNHPGDIKLCRVNDPAGPVTFDDPGNDTNLSYTYSGPADDSDGLEYSSDNGATFIYEPVPDADGCDANITQVRVRPGGAMAAGSTFTLRLRYIIRGSGQPTP